MGCFAKIKEVAALRDGFIFTTLFTIGGSLFLLIANFPIPGYTEFMASIFGSGWAAPLNQVAGATFDVLAIIVVLTMTYKYCEAEGCDAISAAVLAMCAFLIVIKSSILSPGGEDVASIIPKLWVGSNGVITAIIVSIIVSRVFCYCEKNHVMIKMPLQVPGGVAKAFAVLIPAVIIFAGAATIYLICDVIAGMTFPELVFKGLQTSLQILSDTIGGGIIIVAGIQSVLFWAGIHGPNIVGVMNPVLLANALDNQHIIDAGMSLVGNPDAKVITIQFTDVFIKSGGCGMMIAAFIKTRSSQLKSISRLALIPGLFNINEPIIFSLPIVFNLYLLFPFIVVPVIAMIITYTAIVIGFMPYSRTMDKTADFSRLIDCRLAGCCGADYKYFDVLVYLPFVRVQDNAFYKEEQEENNN